MGLGFSGSDRFRVLGLGPRGCGIEGLRIVGKGSGFENLGYMMMCRNYLGPYTAHIDCVLQRVPSLDSRRAAIFLIAVHIGSLIISNSIPSYLPHNSNTRTESLVFNFWDYQAPDYTATNLPFYVLDPPMG